MLHCGPHLSLGADTQHCELDRTVGLIAMKPVQSGQVLSGKISSTLTNAQIVEKEVCHTSSDLKSRSKRRYIGA